MMSAPIRGLGSNQYRSKPSGNRSVLSPQVGLRRQLAAVQSDPLAALAQARQTIAQQRADASDLKTVPLKLAELAASRYPQVRDAALGNPNVPAEVLGTRYIDLGGLTFATRSYYGALKSMAWEHDLELVLSNPACPTWVCVDAASYTWPADMQPGNNELRLQHLAAAHINCPPDIVERHWAPTDGWENWLANSSGSSWKSRSGGHCRTILLQKLHWSPHTLERVAADGHFTARALVAGNRYCPPEALQKLASDSTKTVARAVAGNPNTPPSALDRLLRHREPDVSQAAYRNLNLSSATRAMWQLAHN
jgi:hypothetical protein